MDKHAPIRALKTPRRSLDAYGIQSACLTKNTEMKERMMIRKAAEVHASDRRRNVAVVEAADFHATQTSLSHVVHCDRREQK